jgi:hypothetical protein
MLTISINSLSDESAQAKILFAHRIVSPMLLGIKDGSGFGNNAEEIKTCIFVNGQHCYKTISGTFNR